MDNISVKVNELAKQLLFDKHLTAVDLADALNLGNDAAYKLLKRSDWRISEMQVAGKLLNFNFFELFVTNQSKEAALGAQLKAREDELSAMKIKMDLLEQENKYLKELVEMAKMKLRH